MSQEPILVGVSTCLLGEEVRWDGGHKNNTYVRDLLGRFFTFVPVCPEVEVGMPVPREPIHLAGTADAPRLIGSRTGDDWTARMERYARDRVEQLATRGLSGYILKKGSPSCGMERVPVKNEKGMPHKAGRGLFAAALMDRLPLLPVEEEGRLNDPVLRENFIVRVFAFHRLQRVFAGRFKRKDVIDFHSREKFLLMAHSPRHYKELGRLVARIKEHRPTEFRDLYVPLYMEALQTKATPRKNVNVLHHILGFLKDALGPAEKQDILRVVENYRRGLVPLIVPLTLLAHHLKVHEVDYLLDQVYLNPAPEELALRNHV